MKYLKIKDWIIVVLSIALIALIAYALTREDAKDLLLEQKLNLYELQIRELQKQADSYYYETKKLAHDITLIDKQRDSLRAELDNQEPTIKIIYKKIKENEKDIIPPTPNELDSTFNSLLNR